MIYTKPDYYSEFRCIADQCQDTCCAGWQIVIDEDSLNKYQNEQSDYSKKLQKSIDWKEGVFKQNKGKRCAFLNEDNLCDMCLNLGEDSLCDTCARYPRHIEEFENIREYSLSVSCPEVARILLNNKKAVTYIDTETEEEEEFEDYDPFLFSVLEDGRTVIQRILQNRKMDISLRVALVWNLAEEMQECIDEGALFRCGEICSNYEQEEVQAEIQKQLEQWEYSVDEQENNYAFAYKAFQCLYELEHLTEDWEYYLEETDTILYAKGAGEYQKLRQSFEKWMKQNIPDWKVMAEQLLVYFIYTYFCGAVYDGAVAAKVRMSVVSVHFIYEMMKARWKKSEGFLDMEDIILIVYRYSRELEHSDVNLDLMEEFMDEYE